MAYGITRKDLDNIQNSQCGRSEYLKQCGSDGNVMAMILYKHFNTGVPIVTGLNSTQVRVISGNKYSIQNGLGTILDGSAKLHTNRKGVNPVAADFVAPFGTINLNLVAENQAQGGVVRNQGATIWAKIIDLDFPQNVNALSVTLEESIETDDSTPTNPFSETYQVQVKKRCSGNDREQASFFWWESLDPDDTCNRYIVPKDYGLTFAVVIDPVDGSNRVREMVATTIPVGTGMSISQIGATTEETIEITCQADTILYQGIANGVLKETKSLMRQIEGALRELRKYNDIPAYDGFNRNDVKSQVKKASKKYGGKSIKDRVNRIKQAPTSLFAAPEDVERIKRAFIKRRNGGGGAKIGDSVQNLYSI